MTSKPTKGFSLVELLAVVLIIGILAAVAIPSYTRYIRKSKVSEAVSNLVSIDTYEETYYSENDQYVCLAANPATVPSGGTRQDFDGSSATWTSLGRVIADGTPLNFQYQAWAGQFTSSPPTLSVPVGNCVSDYNGTVTPGSGTCTNTLSPSMLAIPPVANSHFFFISAVSDQDGDGTCSLIVKVIDRPDLYKKDEIE